MSAQSSVKSSWNAEYWLYALTCSYISAIGLAPPKLIKLKVHHCKLSHVQVATETTKQQYKFLCERHFSTHPNNGYCRKRPTIFYTNSWPQDSYKTQIT